MCSIISLSAVERLSPIPSSLQPISAIVLRRDILGRHHDHDVATMNDLGDVDASQTPPTARRYDLAGHTSQGSSAYGLLQCMIATGACCCILTLVFFRFA